MNRFGAFLVHLAISLVIFFLLAALVLFVWYPDFFFAADGGWEGIRIIILVDLVARPAAHPGGVQEPQARAEARTWP
jgi:hypothetical protein